MKRIIGIDPGLTGGLGVLDVDDTGGELAFLRRTPTVRLQRGRKHRIEYDVPAMRALLANALDGRADNVINPRMALIHDVQVVLEQQQAMPARLRGRVQGGRSTFRTGLGYGLWLGLVVAARVRYQTVRPVVWKRSHGLLGTDKKASRLRCAERFPQLAPIRAADEGPAEALLMAACLAQRGEKP
jgi:hypothetical protein